MAEKGIEIKKVSIIGMGALGLLYGGFIAEKGIDVTFIMDEERYAKYHGQAISCNGTEKVFSILPVSKAEKADLVIVAVKYNDLNDALSLVEPCIKETTVIGSVLNGIQSEEIIAARFGMERLIYMVAQGMDAMKFGNQFQYTKMGNLHIGAAFETQGENLVRVKDFFMKIQMPYVEERDIRYRMWSKFMLNVGVNQICMVYGTDYSGALQPGEANRMMISAMREVIALANAERIALTEKDINQYVDILRTLSPRGIPSMGQDRINQKRSEVNMFAGTVIELAKRHHIFVPVNEYLYEQVKEIEKKYEDFGH